jgi:hypothetical protein
MSAEPVVLWGPKPHRDGAVEFRVVESPGLEWAGAGVPLLQVRYPRSSRYPQDWYYSVDSLPADLAAAELAGLSAEGGEAAGLGYRLASTQAALDDLRGRFESEDLPEDLAAELSSPEKPAALKLYRLLRERVLGMGEGETAVVDLKQVLKASLAAHGAAGEKEGK